MRRTAIFFVVVLGALLSGCDFRGHSSRPQLQEEAASGIPSFPISSDPAAATNLFLHLIAPRYYTDPPTPPQRIISTRVHLSREISISIGEPVFNGDHVLKGHIEWRHGKYFGHLEGRLATTMNYFDGELKLEHPVYSQSGLFSGGIARVLFLLSTNSDCSPILKEKPQ